MKLTTQQQDRAIGTILGSAVGDALGAPYEFGPAHDDDFTPRYGRGSFGHEPGEWTDDTAMAMPILRWMANESDAHHGALDDPRAFREIVRCWSEWSTTAKDVGVQTRAVLRRIEAGLPGIRGERETDEWAVDAREAERLFRGAAREQHERSGRSGGNGSLMRTGPVGLAGIADAVRRHRETPDPAVVAAAAGRVAQLTHWEDDNVDACVLWTLAIQHAVLTGELDIEGGLEQVPAGARRERWAGLIREALVPGAHPRDFAANNGWVVAAFQAALAAVAGASGYLDAIERAIRGGNDTDTVAAITGSLAGARWGSTQIPLTLTRRVHGWPGWDANDLARLAVLAVKGGGAEAIDAIGWPLAPSAMRDGFDVTPPVQHPLDPGVWLGSESELPELRKKVPGVGAVVSLCRVGTAEVPAGLESIRVWLIDTPGKNLNLDQTLIDTVDLIAELRAEGTEVFVHCAEAHSRTAAIAALYAVRHRGATLADAWQAAHVLKHCCPAPFLQDAVNRIARG